MSTLSLPVPSSSFIPAGFVSAVCVGCGTAILVPDRFDAAPCCQACRQSHAEHEAQRLALEARDLAAGTGIYADVPADERREQIRAIILGTDVDPEPASKTPAKALADLVDVLPDSSIDLVADLVSRRIAERRRPAGRTLVQIAIGDVSDAGLIELVGTTDDPIILNAASAELANRLGNRVDALQMPPFRSRASDAPDAATRDELESKIELVPAPVFVPDDEHPLAGSWDADFAA